MGVKHVFNTIQRNLRTWGLVSLPGFFLFAVLCQIFFFENNPQIGEYRLVADNLPLELKKSEQPGVIENDSDGNHLWGIRKPADLTPVNSSIINGIQFLKDVAILAREHGKTAMAPLAPVLSPDGSTPPRLLASLPTDRGEALDLDGNPLRWHLPDNLLVGYSIPRVWRYTPPKEEPPPEKPLRLSIRRGNASHYRELVESFATRYGLSPDLVMAIIHSESDFSPTIVSNKSAMGLMQLLPSTASDEVHRFLYGRRGQVGFDDLSVPETNIKYGTAYLHILFNRYFANVKNRDVREICAIASYNLGPNRFIRLYGPTPEAAISAINSMSPDEFYADLPGRLPARETRFFVEKVRRMKSHYSSIQ